MLNAECLKEQRYEIRRKIGRGCNEGLLQPVVKVTWAGKTILLGKIPIDSTGLAKHLCRDEAAFLAALCMPWSNGPVEAQIHHLKLIKRSMHGRRIGLRVSAD